MGEKSTREFAALGPEKRREIASMGGKTVRLRPAVSVAMRPRSPSRPHQAKMCRSAAANAGALVNLANDAASAPEPPLASKYSIPWPPVTS
jgi:hypothetical protein